jgi:hypothetical protein
MQPYRQDRHASGIDRSNKDSRPLFWSCEDDWSEEGLHHVQLAHAPYAALFVAFEVTSLLGV